jgi:hypothetical protein
VQQVLELYVPRMVCGVEWGSECELWALQASASNLLDARGVSSA